MSQIEPAAPNEAPEANPSPLEAYRYARVTPPATWPAVTLAFLRVLLGTALVAAPAYAYYQFNLAFATCHPLTACPPLPYSLPSLPPTLANLPPSDAVYALGGLAVVMALVALLATLESWRPLGALIILLLAVLQLLALALLALLIGWPILLLVLAGLGSALAFNGALAFIRTLPTTTPARRLKRPKRR